jgi:hypothetical protein
VSRTPRQPYHDRPPTSHNPPAKTIKVAAAISSLPRDPGRQRRLRVRWRCQRRCELGG